ncbi:hypothetical protein ACXZ66_01985 [Corynebacterium sp. S7]
MSKNYESEYLRFIAPNGLEEQLIRLETEGVIRRDNTGKYLKVKDAS